VEGLEDVDEVVELVEAMEGVCRVRGMGVRIGGDVSVVTGIGASRELVRRGTLGCGVGRGWEGGGWW
jgi:hypothetical protein